MPPIERGLRALLGRFLGRLRFPWLFVVLAGLLLLDLLTPDPIPLLDEAILAVLTFLLALWQNRSDPTVEPKPPMKDVTPPYEKSRR